MGNLIAKRLSRENNYSTVFGNFVTEDQSRPSITYKSKKNNIFIRYLVLRLIKKFAVKKKCGFLIFCLQQLQSM
jgi:hypothetical protein